MRTTKPLSTRALRILTNVELAHWDEQTKAYHFDVGQITDKIRSGEMRKYRDLGNKTYNEIASYFGVPYTKPIWVRCPQCGGRGRVQVEVEVPLQP